MVSHFCRAGRRDSREGLGRADTEHRRHDQVHLCPMNTLKMCGWVFCPAQPPEMVKDLCTQPQGSDSRGQDCRVLASEHDTDLRGGLLLWRWAPPLQVYPSKQKPHSQALGRYVNFAGCGPVAQACVCCCNLGSWDRVLWGGPHSRGAPLVNQSGPKPVCPRNVCH